MNTAYIPLDETYTTEVPILKCAETNKLLSRI
jgi:hypothetical protein